MRSTETFGAVFKACCQLASTDFSEGSIFQHGDDDPKEEIQPWVHDSLVHVPGT